MFGLYHGSEHLAESVSRARVVRSESRFVGGVLLELELGSW